MSLQGAVTGNPCNVKHSVGVILRIPKLSFIIGTRLGYVPILALRVKAIPSLLDNGASIMLIDEFISQFKTYCQQRFPSETGTATSYTNAVKYLLEFMGSAEVTKSLILEIRSLEPDIRDADSILYVELEEFYTSTGRSSYLKKGFLKAALPVLFEFSNSIILQDDDNLILLNEVKDNQVIADFSAEQ